jgi:hypothetical protein
MQKINDIYIINKEERFKEVEKFINLFKKNYVKDIDKKFNDLFIANQHPQCFFEYCIMYSAEKNDFDFITFIIKYSDITIDLHYSKALEIAITNESSETINLLLSYKHFSESLKKFNNCMYKKTKTNIIKEKVKCF